MDIFRETSESCSSRFMVSWSRSCSANLNLLFASLYYLCPYRSALLFDIRYMFQNLFNNIGSGHAFGFPFEIEQKTMT